MRIVILFFFPIQVIVHTILGIVRYLLPWHGWTN